MQCKSHWFALHEMYMIMASWYSIGHHLSRLTIINIISRLSERVYRLYFIAFETWVIFVHRQRTTVRTRSLPVDGTQKWCRAHRTPPKKWTDCRVLHVNEHTDETAQYFSKQLNNENHRKCFTCSNAGMKKTLLWI